MTRSKALAAAGMVAGLMTVSAVVAYAAGWRPETPATFQIAREWWFADVVIPAADDEWGDVLFECNRRADAAELEVLRTSVAAASFEAEDGEPILAGTIAAVPPIAVLDYDALGSLAAPPEDAAASPQEAGPAAKPIRTRKARRARTRAPPCPWWGCW